MFRNQLASLIDSERIVTTLPKAKELRPIAEKLITLAKNDSVHARRQAARQVADDRLIAKLFDTIGPRFSTRPGGYTRIMKLGARRGDSAEMAILELVERSETTETPAETKPAPKGGRKKAAAAPAEKPAAEEKPKRTRKAAPKAEAAGERGGEEKPKRTRKKKEE